MANGMTGLYIGASGLQAAQAALNTTAHNLSNINTTGYTRQQITYTASSYFNIGESATALKQYGIGVAVQEIRRVRDDFIDKAYRQESGRLGYYSSQYDAVTEVESQFGELQGVTYEESLTNLKNAFIALQNNPTSTVARSSLIQYATAFIDRSTSIYNGLVDYQTTLNTKVGTTVDRINTLSENINTLNHKIQTIEASGQTANDLRDQRDNALDELSGYIKIEYNEEPNGVVNVTAEGVPLVNGGYVTKMSTKQVDNSNLLVPIWPELNNREVFIEGEKITAINNNDIGELKGLLLARGSQVVDYTTVPVEPAKEDYDLTTEAGLQAYNDDYAAYKEDCAYYDKYIDPSVILSTMASLDKLVNGIVTAVNDVLCPNTEEPISFTAADGTVYNNVYVLDMNKTSYGMDADKTVGQELFARKFTDRYIKVEADDGTTYYVFNTKNSLGNDSDYKLGNLQMNANVTQNIDQIPLSNSEGGEDFDKATELVDIWDEKFAALNPSTYAKEDFLTFYNSLVAEFADAGSVLDNYVSNQQTMVDGYDSQRLQTEGVSSDEELQNMIKFQQAYNASSRYVNVVDAMLEHIINRLGS